MPDKSSLVNSTAFKERLRNIAIRLTRLQPKSSQQSTPLNFAVGALFSLVQADLLDYPSQARVVGRGKRMWEKAKGICSSIERGKVSLERGEWLAGFFFNDGIIRIDVAFEHIVRHSIKLHGYVKHSELLKKAHPQGFKKEWADSWGPVHKEVNRLKHENRKFADGPALTYNKAIEALDNLYFALQWGMKHGR